MGPKNIQQSGAIADGILPVYWPGTRWPALREQLDAGSQQAGRPAGSTRIAPYITTAILRDNATEQEIMAVRQKVAFPLAYYIGRMGVYYAQMLSRNGYAEDVQKVIDGWQQGSHTAIAAVSPQLLEATSIIGNARECVVKLDQWAAAGVDEPILTMPEGSLDEVAAQLSALKSALAEGPAESR
jgi:alkanesulfonate monooxygenase SsuD/methylene tetrahydromethanopterin reductase-like flavin-dependent oxidoreductase (luciferase family)